MSRRSTSSPIATTWPWTLAWVYQLSTERAVKEPRVAAPVVQAGPGGVETEQDAAVVLQEIPGGDRHRTPVGGHGRHDRGVGSAQEAAIRGGRGMVGMPSPKATSHDESEVALRQPQAVRLSATTDRCRTGVKSSAVTGSGCSAGVSRSTRSMAETR